MKLTKARLPGRRDADLRGKKGKTEYPIDLPLGRSR
jgi:hypothetical protein